MMFFNWIRDLIELGWDGQEPFLAGLNRLTQDVYLMRRWRPGLAGARVEYRAARRWEFAGDERGEPMPEPRELRPGVAEYFGPEILAGPESERGPRAPERRAPQRRAVQAQMSLF